jgi:hypothetical protein
MGVGRDLNLSLKELKLLVEIVGVGGAEEVCG